VTHALPNGFAQYMNARPVYDDVESAQPFGSEHEYFVLDQYVPPR
jgi:hypothetical protein